MSKSLDENERRELRKKARTATLDALRALGGEAQRTAIYDWTLAHGNFTSRELSAAPPEGGAEKYRSAVDHQLAWTLTNLKHDGLVEKPERSIWKLTSAATPAATTAVVEPVEAKRLSELRAMPYRLYLRTPEWRRTRAAALLRAGNACSLDVTHTESLEVHHRTYERLGVELTTDLVVLCHSCHQLHHEEYGLPRRERHGEAPSLPRAIDGFAPVLPTKRPKRSLLRRLFAS